MLDTFTNLFADALDFQAPADYIGGIILAVIAAFGGLGFIVAAGAGIVILIQKKIALAAGDDKKVKQFNKNLISLIVTMVILAVIVPLCGVFASSMIGNDMGLTNTASYSAFIGFGILK